MSSSRPYIFAGVAVLVFVGFMLTQAQACEIKCSAQTYSEKGYDARLRNQTIDCLFDAVDRAPRNGKITAEKFEVFRQRALSRMERFAATWSRVKDHCACDCDDVVTREEAQWAWKGCLGSDFLIGQAYKRLCINRDPTELSAPDNVDPKDWNNNQ
jgi:hypothetical protein